jgi:hypothetical protein
MGIFERESKRKGQSQYHQSTKSTVSNDQAGNINSRDDDFLSSDDEPVEGEEDIDSKAFSVKSKKARRNEQVTCFL